MQFAKWYIRICRFLFLVSHVELLVSAFSNIKVAMLAAAKKLAIACSEKVDTGFWQFDGQ